MSGKTELMLFDDPLPQVVVESAFFHDVSPLTSISDQSSKLDFIIHGSEGHYLDLNDTLLYIQYQVVDAKGATLADSTTVYPCNFTMNALFRDVTLQLNDTVIEGGAQLYPYKATIANLFAFNKESKKAKLLPMGYEEDADKRKQWIQKSKICELIGGLRLDFLNQPKYLLPGVNVRISLTRSNNKFVLGGAGLSNPKVILKLAKLYVRRVKVSNEVQVAHEKGLLKKNAIYPYTRSQLITYSIAMGSLSHYRDDIFSSSLLPKFVIIGMVTSAAFNGDKLEEEPFHFNHFNVQSVGLFRDGQSVPFREVYETNFDEGLVTKAYMKSLILNVQHLNTNFNNGMTLDNFEKGQYTFFTFNLTPDFDMTQQQTPCDGNLRLELKFAKALEKPINVIAFGIFDTQIQITKEKQIICTHVH